MGKEKCLLCRWSETLLTVKNLLICVGALLAFIVSLVIFFITPYSDPVREYFDGLRNAAKITGYNARVDLLQRIIIKNTTVDTKNLLKDLETKNDEVGE